MAPIKRLRGLYLRGNVWWFTWRHNGKKHFVSLQTDDQAAAITRALKVAGLAKFSRSDRLSDERERFLAVKKSSGHFARHTGEWAATPLKRLEVFTGNLPPASIRLSHLQNFYIELRRDLADTSAASYMRAVRSFFSWLVEKKVIHESPCKGLKLPKVAQAARIRFCSGDQRRRLIESTDDWDLRFVLYCGMHAGLRKNEIIEAVPEWFDLARGLVTVERTAHFIPKDRERRSVPLTREFLEFLGTYPLPHPFLLKPGIGRGRSLYRYDFRLPFQQHVEAQGLAWVTPHVMRHTFAALYVSAGGSLYRLAHYLGDTPETTERHYAHLAPDREDIERGHGLD